MQALLNEMELDVQQLKCLIQSISADANPVLKAVAKRNILQMRERLDVLSGLLDVTTEAVPAESAKDVSPEQYPVSDGLQSVSQILAERIKPATDLRHAISLNDSFRFARELFGGDAARMNETVNRLGGASSLDEVMGIFNATVHVDEENEAAADFMELLKKYFS